MLLCLHRTLALHNINDKTHANKLIFLYLGCPAANKKYHDERWQKESQKLCFSILSGNFFLFFWKGISHFSLGPTNYVAGPDGRAETIFILLATGQPLPTLGPPIPDFLVDYFF